MTELKPCPKCGFAEPVAHNQYDEFNELEYFVSCENCGFINDFCDSPKQAIEEWNGHFAHRLKAENEKLRGGLQTLLNQCIEEFGDPEGEDPNGGVAVYVESGKEGDFKFGFLQDACNLLKGGE